MGLEASEGRRRFSPSGPRETLPETFLETSPRFRERASAFAGGWGAHSAPGVCSVSPGLATREVLLRLLLSHARGVTGPSSLSRMLWDAGLAEGKFENSEASARLQRTRFLCGGRPLALGCGRCWINGPQRPTTPGPSHWKGRFPPSPPASAACECLGLEMGLSRAFSGSAVVERRWHLAV